MNKRIFSSFLGLLKEFDIPFYSTVIMMLDYGRARLAPERNIFMSMFTLINFCVPSLVSSSLVKDMAVAYVALKLWFQDKANQMSS